MKLIFRTATVAVTITALAALTACAAGTTAPSPIPSEQAVVAPTLDDTPLQEQLMAAVVAGNLELATLAIDAGADPSEYDATDNSPFRIAIVRNDYEMVAMMVDRGATIDWPEYSYTELAAAAQYGSAEITQLLVDAGGTANGLGDGLGGPLINAAYANNVDALEVLLNAGADPNASGTVGGTFAPPLFAAAYAGSLEAAEMLLMWGADSSMRDENGYAPSDWATSQRHHEVAEYLRLSGA